MADTADCIYFAGFFDGEGCVGMYKKRYVVSLTNTDKAPLIEAQKNWGGFISCQPKEGRKFAIQDLYRWQIYGHSAKQFLRDIRPYTRIKSEQIDCYLETIEFVPNKKGGKRTPEAQLVIAKAIVSLGLMKRGIHV